MNLPEKRRITGSLCILRALLDGDNVSARSIQDALRLLAHTQPSYVAMVAKRQAEMLWERI